MDERERTCPGCNVRGSWRFSWCSDCRRPTRPIAPLSDEITDEDADLLAEIGITWNEEATSAK